MHDMHIKNHVTELHFLCVLHVAMVRASCSGAAIRYAFPVLWITSRFFFDGPCGVTLSQQNRCTVVYGLTPLLRGISCLS